MRGCVLYDACRRVIGPSLSLSGWSWTILRRWQVRPKHKIVWGAILGVPSNQNKSSDFKFFSTQADVSCTMLRLHSIIMEVQLGQVSVCLDDPGPFLVAEATQPLPWLVVASLPRHCAGHCQTPSPWAGSVAVTVPRTPPPTAAGGAGAQCRAVKSK